MGNFDMLPVDVISNILTRLPAETVLDCKLVSKTWNRIVGYESFSKSHLNRCLKNLDSGSSGKSTFLIANDNPLYAYRLFHYLEYVENEEEEPFHRVRRMKLNPAPFRYYTVTGSCHGLVCLDGCHDNEWVNYEPMYVCNPITRECVFLPEFERTGGPLGHRDRLVSGFGYVSSTNEYKIVRVYHFKEETSMYLEVYTLGSGKGWRNAVKIFDKDQKLFKTDRGVLVNESLYWGLKNGELVAFDLASELFAEIPTGIPTSWALGELGGYLSATHNDEDSNAYDIMLLKKNKEDGSLTWIKEFSVSNTDTYRALALTGRGTVLCRSETEVQTYDLSSSSSKLLVNFGKGKHIFQAIPHINTLVSLKALGEENTKTMELNDVPTEVKFENPFEAEFYAWSSRRILS